MNRTAVHKYIAKIPSTGEVIYVSANKYDYSYEGLKLFMGKPGKLEEVKIKNVALYRDGGTTFLETDKGVIHFPFRGDASLQPTGSSKKLPVERQAHWEMKDSEIEAQVGKQLLSETTEKGLRTPCDQFHPDKAHAGENKEQSGEKNHK